MDLRQLEYVLAIARTGSFTAAAAECHVAQSALSHQIARLEAQLAVRLFDRSSRALSLTEAGLLVLPYAERALDEIDGMQAALAVRAGQTSGRVRLGITQTSERIFAIAEQVAGFRHANPAVTISLTIGPAEELVDALSHDELDLAYAAAPMGTLPRGVTFRTLVPAEPLVAVVPASHRLASAEVALVRDLDLADGFIEFRPPSALRSRTTQLLTSAGRRPRAAVELGSIAEMVRFAAAGVGVAIVPRVFADKRELRALEPSPHKLRLQDAGASLAFGVYERTGTASVAVSAFALETASMKVSNRDS